MAQRTRRIASATLGLALVLSGLAVVPAAPAGATEDDQPYAIERVSVSTENDHGNAASDYPDVSHTARYVAYSSAAANLVTGDTNSQTDVFVRDRRAGTW